jgi:hypothetical protein
MSNTITSILFAASKFEIVFKQLFIERINRNNKLRMLSGLVGRSRIF